ncbi:NAD-dependent epimerase/dehydratase family protein [Nocardiopsis potens]|uniref:NAD-dependent epimerase/dehydratase family protein n=1 Tax=Nocardiopsis potens TaxID=1246458 RepID=UPI00034CDFBF|nr:NAD(P)-dependent oxidoreductase [Nocardiopsis potens]
MRVLVAGATGAVGRLLVPLLLRAGHEVTGTSRTEEGAARVRAQGARAVRADALDAGALHEAVSEAAPDAVIHQLTDLSGADGAANGRLRREGTRNLVDAAAAAGVRRIVAQSICWTYAPGDGPAGESVPLDDREAQPRAGMVGAVRALEETAAELETAVLLRYGILYGPGTWYAPGGAVAAALAGEPGAPFLGSLEAGDAVSSFVHVADAARAAVAALDWPGGPVNIADDEPAPAREWLPVLAGALGVPAPAPAAEGSGPDWARGADNALARSRGWTPEHPTWRTGFADQGA